ncbi:hypothetical protein GUF79_18600, partial [Xanthomonas citri pv. citri]|nr:hypothetical protein [Xanthomonas citri pv. citri]
VSCGVIDLIIGELMIELIILSLFMVKSYLGKILVGCIYSLDLFVEEEVLVLVFILLVALVNVVLLGGC